MRREEGRGAWTSGAEREVARARSGAEKGEARCRAHRRGRAAEMERECLGFSVFVYIMEMVVG